MKPNARGTVEITDPAKLAEISENIGVADITGVLIDFEAEIYYTPPRITSDPGTSDPEEYSDERRATSITIAYGDGESVRLDNDSASAALVEELCEAEIYGALAG